MKLSKFGEKFTRRSGITCLMEDLNHGLTSGEDIIMMGGGNPSHIPAMQQIFQEKLQKIITNPTQFKNLIGVYDSPLGDLTFRKSLAKLLRNQFNWPINENNIALTNGSQSAFFILFNLFAGEFNDGTFKKILFPLCPEYIGYSDLGLSQSFFLANQPRIEEIDQSTFKYRLQFDTLDINESIGALCLSRPTNPSGNVITDQELLQLQSMAAEKSVPLIIDSAYGTPFPNIIFTEATPLWNQHTIVSMSLSKLGLPTTRTGIIIAHEEIIQTISEANAIISLSTGSFGAMITQDLLSSGEIITISNNIVKPFYQQQAQQAVAFVHEIFSGIPYKVHKSEGAIFLWLWFEGLPISTQVLYERLKSRGVYVIAGHHFFPGLQSDWQHQHECIRITYTQDKDIIKKGLTLIAEEVKKAFLDG